MRNITKAYTHAGVFHADDVFGSALLKIVYPDIIIERVFKVPELSETEIAFDIGGGEFDHHQEVKYRDPERTMPYAAFGLLWKEFGKELVLPIGFDLIEKELVIPIDQNDNGMGFNPMSSFIKSLNQNWDEPKDPEKARECFDKAVDFAMQVLMSFINKAKSLGSASLIIQAAIMDNATFAQDHILVLNEYVPWKELCKDMKLLINMAVYPSMRGGYNIESIDSEIYPLPKEWTETLPEGMSFCHLNRFLAATDTFDNAIKYAYIAKEKMPDPEEVARFANLIKVLTTKR